MEKLAASLADAQVDLNPHQVEAALFAFRSPLSKGAILADEVGLGKTIEAGTVCAVGELFASSTSGTVLKVKVAGAGVNDIGEVAMWHDPCSSLK